MTLDLRRRFFAEEIEAVSRLRSGALVEAFAAVPRERFLPPGPWTVLGETDLTGVAPMKTRLTADADPARVHHNIGVAIDAARQLFNGQPATLGALIDALDLSTGQRVLHVGAGLGYYTAIMAHCVGPSGRVVAYEVDQALAAGAERNLSSMPWVELRHGDASRGHDTPESFHAILINAGVTHPLPYWLDALAPDGRMILPLTTSMSALGLAASPLGKGLVCLLTNEGAAIAARIVNVIMIYGAIGLRDESLGAALGKAMMGGPMHWQKVAHLRRDAHESDATCWYHGSGFCLSTL